MPIEIPGEVITLAIGMGGILAVLALFGRGGSKKK